MPRRDFVYYNYKASIIYYLYLYKPIIPNRLLL